MFDQSYSYLRAALHAATCAFIITALLLLSGCHVNRDRSERRDRSDRERESWSEHVNTFLDDYFKANPDFAVRAGRHEFDGKLPDWSPEGLRKTIEFLREEQDRLRDYQHRGLDDAEQFEREYL